MSAQIDCPICLDCIETSKNCVTTECGHCFHTSCLMTSVAHNGFGCPYCRAKMAEEPEKKEYSAYSVYEVEEEEAETAYNTYENEEVEVFIKDPFYFFCFL